MQNLIAHSLDTGSARAISERVAFLVLPRPGEALKMKDDAGQRVESESDGYELKGDQVLTALKGLGIDNLPVLFFNAASDRALELRERLVGVVTRVREAHADRIGSLARTIDGLIANYEVEAAAAVRRAVIHRLRIFAEQHQGLTERLQPAHDLLSSALQTAHARTVWATTRRRGSWYNLDVFYYLGAGAATEAKRRSDPAFGALHGLLENMVGDPGLETARGFLDEVRIQAGDWGERFLQAARHAGEETFRPALQDAHDLWSTCEGRWGLGPGYRKDVAAVMRDWFADPVRDHLHRALEARVKAAWESDVVRPLQSLCDDTANAARHSIGDEELRPSPA